MTSERFVAVAEVSQGEAANALLTGQDMGVPESIKFTSREMRYFKLEYALVDRDVIVHFFVGDQVASSWAEANIQKWWLNDFATALSSVAQQHFDATLPRIMAKYTTELASWWFKAQGYDHLLDLDAFLLAFFERLDETLHSELLRARARA